MPHIVPVEILYNYYAQKIFLYDQSTPVQIRSQESRPEIILLVCQ